MAVLVFVEDQHNRTRVDRLERRLAVVEESVAVVVAAVEPSVQAFEACVVCENNKKNH